MPSRAPACCRDLRTAAYVAESLHATSHQVSSERTDSKLQLHLTLSLAWPASRAVSITTADSAARGAARRPSTPQTYSKMARLRARRTHSASSLNSSFCLCRLRACRTLSIRRLSIWARNWLISGQTISSMAILVPSACSPCGDVRRNRMQTCWPEHACFACIASGSSLHSGECCTLQGTHELQSKSQTTAAAAARLCQSTGPLAAVSRPVQPADTRTEATLAADRTKVHQAITARDLGPSAGA